MTTAPDHLADCRAALAAGDVRGARVALEQARRAYHEGTGESPASLEARVHAAEHGSSYREGVSRWRR